MFLCLALYGGCLSCDVVLDALRNAPVEQEVLGLYLIRGDNMCAGRHSAWDYLISIAELIVTTDIRMLSLASVWLNSTATGAAGPGAAVTAPGVLLFLVVVMLLLLLLLQSCDRRGRRGA